MQNFILSFQPTELIPLSVLYCYFRDLLCYQFGNKVISFEFVHGEGILI